MSTESGAAHGTIISPIEVPADDPDAVVVPRFRCTKYSAGRVIIAQAIVSEGVASKQRASKTTPFSSSGTKVGSVVSSFAIREKRDA